MEACRRSLHEKERKKNAKAMWVTVVWLGQRRARKSERQKFLGG
jgi:hypothetical protein